MYFILDLPPINLILIIILYAFLNCKHLMISQLTFSNFLLQKFFHKVSERLSNPNIFIVHNRSDAFVGEDMQDAVKSQHMDRAIKFLVNELKVCQSKAEAEERIFFISAKEALHTRMQVHT